MSRWGRALGAARDLGPDDWCLLGEVWLRILFVTLLLRARRPPRIPTATRPSVGVTASEPTLRKIERLGRIVRLASCPQPLPAQCLPRSLVLHGMLLRRRIRTDFRIGVRTEKGLLYAHAWLEYEGSAVVEPESVETDFLPLVAGGEAR